MIDNQDEDQNNLLDANSEDKGLDDEISNKIRLPPRNLLLKEQEELLKSLISSIEQMKAEATNASYSFEANTQEVITSIQNTKEAINKVLDLINYNGLKNLDKNLGSFVSQVR